MSLLGGSIKSGVFAGTAILGVTFSALGLLHVFTDFGAKKPSVSPEQYVKLRPVLVPYKKNRSSAQAGYMFTAVFLKVKDPKLISKTCRLEPRIQDALMQQFHKNPINGFYYQDVGEEKTQFLSSVKIEKKLLNSIKKVTGRDVIGDVKMMKDNRSSKIRNSSGFPLPFLACGNVTK